MRPDFTTVENSFAFLRSAFSSRSSAGSSSSITKRSAARWIADGNTSLDDCDAFTWSFGCTGAPSRSEASDAMTSFMFMFDDVPEPVWNTSIGNWSSYVPKLTSEAASWMAFAMSLSITPSRPLTVALTPLIAASAAIRRRSMRSPEIGKLSTARWVWAPHRASSGTRTSPMVSCSTRM